MEMEILNITKWKHKVVKSQKQENILKHLLHTWLYMYLNMKSIKNDFPFLNAPATDTATTSLSLTASERRIRFNAVSSNSKEWSSLTMRTWTGPAFLTGSSSSELHSYAFSENPPIEKYQYIQLIISECQEMCMYLSTFKHLPADLPLALHRKLLIFFLLRHQTLQNPFVSLRDSWLRKASKISSPSLPDEFSLSLTSVTRVRDQNISKVSWHFTPVSTTHGLAHYHLSTS